MERNPQHFNMSFAIGIPTLNRFDYLLPTLMMYSKDFPDVKVYVVDNGNQDIKNHPAIKKYRNLEVMVQDTNIGVAASWNLLCEKIFKYNENALILNDDIYLGKAKKHIEDLCNAKPILSVKRSTIDWCSFIMPKKVFQSVGKFDECFYPAYYEDKSYEYRMKLLAMPVKKNCLLFHFI